MHEFVIYKEDYDDCSASFPIMFIMAKQYVLIGPEYKKGVQLAVSYADFVKCKSPNRLVKNPNFYFFDVDIPLAKIMSIYFYIARKTNTMDLVPKPLLEFASNDQHDITTFYVAKCIDIDLSQVDIGQSRDVYFSTLAGNPCRVVTEKDFSSACIISNHEEVVSRAGPTDDTLKNLVNNIETNAKVHGFLHAKTHIGHVTQQGGFIDYGHAFGLRETSRLIDYIGRLFPPHLKDKAIEKAKIHNIDVAISCTLVDILQYIQGVDNTHEMQHWIIKTLTGYLNADESIFTYLRNNEFILGGMEFGIPEPWVPMKEEFPTYYFARKFF